MEKPSGFTHVQGWHADCVVAAQLYWEGSLLMSKLRVLAIASLLFAGLSSSAYAAPIVVSYALSPGVGANATYNAGGVIGSGFTGGSLTVVYTSGASTIGGTLGSFGSMQIMVASLLTPGTVVGNTVPGILVGAGAGVFNVANSGAISGATLVTANFAGPGVPGVTWTGNIGMPFTAGGSKTINIAFGAGTQHILSFVNVAWTISNVVGTEVSRTVVPEPASGALLFMGLAGLAAYRVPKMRR
jgi:hypothetical protein